MDKTYSFITTSILVLSASIAMAAGGKAEDTRDVAADLATVEQTREIASDFSGEYLDSVTDEKAADALRAQADSAEHDKYLKSMGRGGDRSGGDFKR
jgi:hypothetical protein